jgi:hypothetical protein
VQSATGRSTLTPLTTPFPNPYPPRYEVTKKTSQRTLSQELVLAISSSVTLGFGLFFLALTVGIPV